MYYKYISCWKIPNRPLKVKKVNVRITLNWLSLIQPSTHTTLFWHPYDVVLTWTLDVVWTSKLRRVLTGKELLKQVQAIIRYHFTYIFFISFNRKNWPEIELKIILFLYNWWICSGFQYPQNSELSHSLYTRALY